MLCDNYLLLTFDHTILELFSLEGISGGHWFNSLLKAMLPSKLEQVTSGLAWLRFLLKDVKCSWKLGVKAKFGTKCPKFWKVTEF